MQTLCTALKHAITNLINDFRPMLPELCRLIVSILQSKCVPPVIEISKTVIIAWHTRLDIYLIVVSLLVLSVSSCSTRTTRGPTPCRNYNCKSFCSRCRLLRFGFLIHFVEHVNQSNYCRAHLTPNSPTSPTWSNPSTALTHTLWRSCPMRTPIRVSTAPNCWLSVITNKHQNLCI